MQPARSKTASRGQSRVRKPGTQRVDTYPFTSRFYRKVTRDLEHSTFGMCVSAKAIAQPLGTTDKAVNRTQIDDRATA